MQVGSPRARSESQFPPFWHESGHAVAFELPACRATNVGLDVLGSPLPVIIGTGDGISACFMQALSRFPCTIQSPLRSVPGTLARVFWHMAEAFSQRRVILLPVYRYQISHIHI
jgi:hypothetical protein